MRRKQLRAPKVNARRNGAAVGHVSISLRSVMSFTLLIILIAGLVYGWVWYSQRPLSQIEVVSDGHAVEVSKVQVLVQRYVKKGFFSFSAQKLQHHLQLLPWIDSVSVRRIWPDRLRIAVHERQAVAIWNETQLVTGQAVLFRPSLSTFPADLPRLSGPETQEQMVLHQFQLFAVFFKRRGDTIHSLSLKGHDWRLKLGSGAVVYLNEGEEKRQLNRFNGLYQRVLKSKMRQVEQVDMRYAGGAAVQWLANNG